MASYPEDLRYSKEHLWVRLEGKNRARIGITEYLADKLGRIMDADFTEEEAEVDAAVELGHLTGSGSGSCDLFAPLAGTVAAVNEEILDEPNRLVSDPYDEGWICILRGVDPDEYEALLGPEDYEAQIALEKDEDL